MEFWIALFNAEIDIKKTILPRYQGRHYLREISIGKDDVKMGRSTTFKRVPKVLISLERGKKSKNFPFASTFFLFTFILFSFF